MMVPYTILWFTVGLDIVTVLLLLVFLIEGAEMSRGTDMDTGEADGRHG
jgi:hypothetical protein